MKLQKLGKYAVRAMLVVVAGGMVGSLAMAVVGSEMGAGLLVASIAAGALVALAAFLAMAFRRSSGYDASTTEEGSPPAPWAFGGVGWPGEAREPPKHEQRAPRDPGENKRG